MRILFGKKVIDVSPDVFLTYDNFVRVEVVEATYPELEKLFERGWLFSSHNFLSFCDDYMYSVVLRKKARLNAA